MQFFFSSFGDDIFVVRYRNEGNLEKTHVSVKLGFFMVYIFLNLYFAILRRYS